MRPLFLCLFTSLLVAAAASARAQQNAVVLELFTSQGCSSCPPADALLGELSDMEGVVALALHVDYWDYLGWEDGFARAKFTKRQKGYAKAMRKRSVYTPQMIVHGQDRLVGHDVENILGSIRAHQSQPAIVDVSLARSGGDLRISLTPRRNIAGPVDVHLIKITPESTVEIKAGENHGKAITYTDIVREWSTVAEWDGEEPQEFLVKDGAADHVAVIVQGKRMGPIVAAGELE